MEILYAIIIFIILFALFICAFLLNKKTPRPKGCEEATPEQCLNCTIISCKSRANEEEEKDE